MLNSKWTLAVAVVLFAAFWGFAIFASSKPPIPSTLEESGAPQKPAASSEQTGTQKPPLVVSIAPENQQEAANDAAYQEARTADQHTLEVGVGAVLFGSLQTIALFVTFMLLRRTSHSQMRAYVSAIAKEATLLNDNATVIVKVFMKNVGQTPAFDFQQAGDLLVMPYPMRGHRTFNFVDEGKPIPTYVFYPDTEHAAAPRRTLTEEDFANLKTDKWALYSFGRITYRDAFGRIQCAEYCAALEHKDFWDWYGIMKTQTDRGRTIPAAFKFTEHNNRASPD